MGGFSVGVLTAVLATAAIFASPARAAQFQFVGDQGTVCTVEAGANATQGLNALALPRVGFSGVPVCTYARSASAGSGVGGASSGSMMSGQKRKRSRCKAKRRKAIHGHRHRGCKHKKAKGARSAASRSTGLQAAALLDHGQLDLLGPSGVVAVGAQTLTAAGVGGYTCVLGVGADCSDQGSLSPAIPQLSYFAQYSIRLTPPVGETWIAEPPGCAGGPAPQCVLSSESVTPTL